MSAQGDPTPESEQAARIRWLGRLAVVPTASVVRATDQAGSSRSDARDSSSRASPAGSGLAKW